MQTGRKVLGIHVAQFFAVNVRVNVRVESGESKWYHIGVF